MDETKPEADTAKVRTNNLALAIRRARIDVAQHSEAVAELRGAETARLEMLADALKPILAQVPTEVDLFDAGLAPGEHPRYFIDVLGFVDLARDRRTYRFLQDTRHGRMTIRESDKIDHIVEAVTAYIARRLVEREQALASDQTVEQAARALAAKTADEPEAEQSARIVAPAHKLGQPQTPRRRGFFLMALMFLIELFGSMALIVLLAAAGYFLWTVAAHWLTMRATG